MKIVYLRPRASFRDNLRSDTLWGLICWGIRQLYSEERLNRFLASYRREGDVLKISSSFRYTEDKGEKILFFPKPQMEPFDWKSYFSEKNKIERIQAVKDLKKFKKLRILHMDAYVRLITGQISEVELFENKELWQAKKKAEFISTGFLHNTIDRMSNLSLKGHLYTSEELFAKNSGLFFLLNGNQEDLDAALAALRFYSHFGFGGDSSTGRGCFDVTVEDLNLKIAKDADYFTTLSLYYPRKDEVRFFTETPGRIWYELEVRKGKAGGHFLNSSDFWKESTLMFSEGSVFRSMDRLTYGDNRIVKKKNSEFEFDVYQYGIAFNLPIKLKKS